MNKKSIIGTAALGLFLVLFSGAVLGQSDNSERFQAGLHYFEIDKAPARQSDTIELTELFSYLCTHCYTFEPYIEGWLQRKPDYVKFTRIPVVFGRSSWEIYARAYVTAQMMNAPPEAHTALMNRLWKDRKIMRSMEELADFYTQFGLDRGKFLSTSQSFAVDSKIRRDQQAVQEYRIEGTPSLVLNGKYRISGNPAVGSYDVMLDVVDFLIEKEAARIKAPAAEVATTESGEDGG
jgi:thiol:disulfide interchange protein DsbA